MLCEKHLRKINATSKTLGEAIRRPQEKRSKPTGISTSKADQEAHKDANEAAPGTGPFFLAI